VARWLGDQGKPKGAKAFTHSYECGWGRSARGMRATGRGGGGRAGHQTGRKSRQRAQHKRSLSRQDEKSQEGAEKEGVMYYTVKGGLAWRNKDEEGGKRPRPLPNRTTNKDVFPAQ